jgi:hypothetical protein
MLPLEGDLLPERRLLELGFLELGQGSRELRRGFLKEERVRFCSVVSDATWREGY